MLEITNISDFYKQEKPLPIIDVRSPGEFEKGHIPSAFNIPLFTNEERAQVGTVYKQQSRERAIELGNKLVAPKLQFYIEESFNVAPDGRAMVHCWRGGMRSQAFAQHLLDNGFNEVMLLKNGYKSYRRMVVALFQKPWNLVVIGGYTGSGKTHVLHQLEKMGYQVIDLEGVAQHKGSAFGGIGQPQQPTSEQFENNLFEEYGQMDPTQPVFIEDESLNIGKVNMPVPLFHQIRNATDYFLEVPREERAHLLASDYSFQDVEPLNAAIQRISKKLGGLETQESLKLLEQRKFYEVALRVLHYYDKSYLKGLQNRDSSKTIIIPCNSTDIKVNVEKILSHLKLNHKILKTQPINEHHKINQI